MVINSAHHLAHGLNERLKLGLTPRPWNLHSPADTFWWLVPSSEWPAYRYGKLAFSLSKDVPRKDLLGMNDSAVEPDAIFAGFNVEKGYGKVATVVDPALNRKPAQIIDSRWLWFEVVDESGAARFGRTLAAVAAGADIYLYIISSYAHDRETDTRAQHDALMFKCGPVGLSLVLKNGFPVNVLRGAETETDFVALARRLRGVDDYHWVDLYVGTMFRRETSTCWRCTKRCCRTSTLGSGEVKRVRPFGRWHEVRVELVGRVVSDRRCPEIVEKHGRSPAQYVHAEA